MMMLWIFGAFIKFCYNNFEKINSFSFVKEIIKTSNNLLMPNQLSAMDQNIFYH